MVIMPQKQIRLLQAVLDLEFDLKNFTLVNSEMEVNRVTKFIERVRDGLQYEEDAVTEDGLIKTNV